MTSDLRFMSTASQTKNFRHVDFDMNVFLLIAGSSEIDWCNE